jgi:hypothetical protein
LYTHIAQYAILLMGLARIEFEWCYLKWEFVLHVLANFIE